MFKIFSGLAVAGGFLSWAALLEAAVFIVKSFDIILAKVAANLDFDQLKGAV